MCKRPWYRRLPAVLCLNLGEIPMQLGFDKHDSVEEFLDNLALVLVERVGYVLQVDLCLLVYGCLSVRCRARMLNWKLDEAARGRLGDALMIQTP